MYTILSVLQVIISVVLIFLILLHSGKDAGLSGAFGIGGGGSSLGGGSMVERNLDRATVFFAVRLGAEHLRPAEDLAGSAAAIAPAPPGDVSRAALCGAN